jgi:uncharacterized protein DUF4386
MTRSTNARLAGIAYLLYIAAAFPAMVISRRATAGADITARLANMAQHAFDVRLAAVLTLIGCFCALVLAVTLYAVTRVQDRDLARFAFTCRVAEGVTGGTGIAATLALLTIVTAPGSTPADAPALQTLASFIFADTVFVAATFFAVGSTIFSWLLLRGTMVPTWLAWVGVVGSALAAVAMPLQALGVLSDSIAQLTWAPVGIFEIVVSIWFLIKGVPETEVARAQ